MEIPKHSTFLFFKCEVLESLINSLFQVNKLNVFSILEFLLLFHIMNKMEVDGRVHLFQFVTSNKFVEIEKKKYNCLWNGM